MIYHCPNSLCVSSTKNQLVKKDGFYFRRDDSRRIQRFACKVCGKKFSRATFSLERNQKKRRINYKIFRYMSSPNSMRRAAIEFKVTFTTIQRKIKYLSKKSNTMQKRYLKSLEINKVKNIQFDDMITIEHSKMKPLSISIAVDKKTRKILGARVSRISASGLLAKKSREKYGYRKSTHKEELHNLFRSISKSIANNALFESDEHSLYPYFVRRYFPEAEHRTYKSIRSSNSGQGELKRTVYDPLQRINHTLAMLRENINRLLRKTWCTTKRPDMLQAHLDLFINYHNFYYLKLKSAPS